MFPNMSTNELDAVWNKIDADGDGNLTTEELARFYGFSWDGDAANEMTDEQILEALAMYSQMFDAKQREVEEAKAAESFEKKVSRDTTIVNINSSDLKKNKDVAGNAAALHLLLSLSSSADASRCASHAQASTIWSH